MKRFSALILLTLTMGAVTPVSTDGEATVYLKGDFTGAFDLTYRAALVPSPQNKSWTVLGIMLLGTKNPGPGVEIGLSNGDPSETIITAFTSFTDANGKNVWKTVPTSCNAGCVIELKGDAEKLEAIVAGKSIGSWARASLPLSEPYVQLNAEVDKSGDTIKASLVRIRTTAAGVDLPSPTCAFTTRGIEPSGDRMLTFSGVHNDAQGAFVNLLTSARGDKC
jgi:hypothetical protein